MQLRYLVLGNQEVVGEVMHKDNKNVVSYDLYRGFLGIDLKSIPTKGHVALVDNNDRDWYDEIRQES